MKKKPAARAAELRRILERANHAYYVLDRPEMSDADFDKLFRELQALEDATPELRTADSPTLRVGAEPATAFRKHRHAVPMLSLANAFTDTELEEWEDRNARLAPDVREAGYALEVKIDGAAVSLTYEDGVLVTGVTRGNGVEGEDVTGNLRTVLDLPLRLQGKGWPKSMEVRGEVYLSKSQFTRVNQERERAAEPPFANPRNAAAGALRQLDPRITRARGLRVFCFQVEAPGQKLGVDTQDELLRRLQVWGFPVEPNHAVATNLAAAHRDITRLEKLLPTLDYGADGVAVKVNKRALWAELGVVGNREPRWAVARKFAPEVRITRLLEIRVNVGRTGVLNPYAVLEPVEIGGVTVSTATLHNFDLIGAKDIREGDFVEVTRAGEVIPQVLGPVIKEDQRRKAKYKPPAACPACKTLVEHLPDEVALYCPNATCPGRVYEAIVHFASRGAMDIRGLGYERVRDLLDARILTDVSDLYDEKKLNTLSLLRLEGFAERSAQQLVDAIAASKQRPLSTLLFALGIPNVGAQGAQLIARHFGTMSRVWSATEAEMSAIRGIGPTIASAVVAFFGESRNYKLVTRLAERGLTMTEPATAGSDGPLKGRSYVITGTLPTLSRPEAAARIQAAGGHVTDTVSKKTSAVIVGADPGSKLEKAQALGIETIDEAELLRRVEPEP